MNKAGERLYNGIIKENPTFVLMLGMCPTLAVTTSAMNGLGMGLTTMVVLALSNLMISLLRGIIPSRVRIPAFIVVIASFVTAVQLLLEGFLPDLNKALGVYIPLIVVNCIILGRAESYAYTHPVLPSFFDGVGMGLGFTLALTCIGAVRELLGAGELFGHGIMPASFEPIRIFGLAPGAFFVLAALVALQNYIKDTGKRWGIIEEESGGEGSQSGVCPGGVEGADCGSCGKKGCEKRFYDENAIDRRAPKARKGKKSKKRKGVEEEVLAQQDAPVLEDIGVRQEDSVAGDMHVGKDAPAVEEIDGPADAAPKQQNILGASEMDPEIIDLDKEGE